MKSIYSWLKTVASVINFTRLLVINALFLIIILLVVIAINADEQEIVIADNSILHLNFSGNIVEQKQPLDFSSELSKQLMSSEQSQLTEYQIDEVIQVIHHAGNDPKIKSILLELDALNSASFNHLSDIGDALNAFKAKGKTVNAIADNYSQTQYLLASFADHIYLNPQGLVFLQGFSVYRLYFKEVLDNLLITPHIFKVGTYKSFVEPFTQNHMSEESKLANRHWLNQLWTNYIDTVINERKDKSNITPQSLSPSLAQLKSALQNAGGDTALYAKQVGLVDFLNNRFEVINKLKEQAKDAAIDFTLLSYADYQSTLPRLYQSTGNHDQIALIHGSGEILTGTQKIDAIGSESFNALLDKALNDKQIKAVVIRLDTPGGSAFASEKIRQQVLALKKAGKKVVVSMGSVTASGGYWIASAADYIVAYPSTLTGSIGIFGMYASTDKALNKLGIYNDGVGTSELSALDPTRALNPELAEIMQIGIEHGYQQFLTVVAEGRSMTLQEVDNVAQGRVWTGTDAKQSGLVDQLGGLQDAIDQAAILAGLGQYDIQELEPTLSAKQQLLNEIFISAVQFVPQSVQISPLLQQTISALQSQTALLTKFNDPQGRYAYCPMCMIK
ncbi:signal peptide peptidase SppA [Psychromonas antarctica]|uniref:signal peptide peptidase SppA n=1 Tax=Psychromonas antarctica TaxID=67573 RepID=UPI001EE7BF7C|nr:signal peptide peptidase SppA [Psychromonas antarctica]MCG6200591.1 signal peptide peptidase SppA [Psychromonas antarctica]